MSVYGVGLRKELVMLGCMLLLWLAVYAPLYPELIDTWLYDSNNSHTMLVPFVALYLAWMKRERLHETDRQVALTGLAVLICSLILYIASLIGGLAFPARLTLVTTLAGLVLYNYGWRVWRILAFPITFLFFVVPVPDSILELVSQPLQLVVSKLSAGLIGIYGIPVHRDGNVLSFARYSFEVTEACSGIRSLVSFIAIGALFAYFERNEMWKSIVLLVITVPLAIVVNLIRVAGTGIVANYFGPKVAEGFLHDFSGFVVFGAGIVLLICCASFLNRTTPVALAKEGY